MKKKIMIAFGTRPETIKLAPVIRAFERDDNFEPVIVATAQHREMLDQALKVFGIRPHIDLDLMVKDQKLTGLAAGIMRSMQEVFDREKPDLLICQGDTTSALITGLAAYYNRIPVGHVEAGLRTFDHGHPFPEEGNRQLLSVISSINFCPTAGARKNLLNQGADRKTIFITGNTVIDSLLFIAEKEREFKDPLLKRLNYDKDRVILVTVHRRENFGGSMENIFHSILEIADKYKNTRFVFPVHFNPNVRKTVNELLQGKERIHLLEPIDYEEFVLLMRKSFLILTDSGGVQEEAPTFGVPVLILRKVTERTEAIDGGNALLIGTGKDDIIEQISLFLDHPSRVAAFKELKNPFGDGQAGHKILDAVRRFFGMTT